MTATVEVLPGWAEDEMARLVAQDLSMGAIVNLGIGLPTLIGAHLPPERQVIVHSENGIIGMGPPAASGSEDSDLIDAGKALVTMVPGAAIVDHVTSFILIRGGRLGYSIMGAYEVSAAGDLANWRLTGDSLGGVGGAMDLVAGARHVYVMMQHVDKHGRPKIVETCSCPLTAFQCVERIYTNLGIFEVCPDGIHVRATHPAVNREELQSRTGTVLHWDA